MLSVLIRRNDCAGMPPDPGHRYLAVIARKLCAQSGSAIHRYHFSGSSVTRDLIVKRYINDAVIKSDNGNMKKNGCDVLACLQTQETIIWLCLANLVQVRQQLSR